MAVVLEKETERVKENVAEKADGRSKTFIHVREEGREVERGRERRTLAIRMNIGRVLGCTEL